MGKAGDVLFGKPSKEKSESGNNNNKLLTGALSPALGYLTGGGGMMGNLLGVNGGAAQTQGLENYANAGGMQFLRDQGLKGIESNQAAKGLLNSGSTLTSMNKFNSGLASTYLDHFMSQLNDFSKAWTWCWRSSC
jgi:hypothetical protein